MIALDTNLLIYAHRAGTPEHKAARAAIERAVNDEAGWGIPFPCLAEFWAVVTHPESPGGSSTPEQALSFLSRLLEDGDGRILFLGSASRLKSLEMAAKLKALGPRVFDLQIALTASENGATQIWTHDHRFVSMPGLKVIDPL